jgi:hypothetical protein
VRGGRLEIALRGRRLSVELSGEPFVTAPIAAERHIDRPAAEALSAEMRAILNRATRWGDADQGSRELLRQRAEVLFDALLPMPVKRALREAVGRGERAPLACVVDRELLHRPWVLLHTGQAFIGLAFPFGRVARGLQPELPVVRAPVGARRALVLCDPRGDLIGSYYEGLTLRDELAQHRDWQVDLRSSEVGKADVRRLLREYDVVHFAGHAEPWPPAADAGTGAGGEGPSRGWWLS